MSERLDLRGRGLRALPEQVRSLRSLGAAGNRIAVLPDWLPELPALQRLDRRWNGLVEPLAVVDRLRARGCVARL